MRFFYGKQLKKFFKKAINKETNIAHLVNSVTNNKVRDFNVLFIYSVEVDVVQNINKFLNLLFKRNRIDLDDIYKSNKVKEDISLVPGLYRKIKSYDNSEIINIILNIYLNITGNVPTINTILICNEETSKEKIQSFLYRVVLCNKPILFLIANLERLEFEIMQNLVETLNILYKEKNYNVNSYILFIYEKVDSFVMNEIESILPEKNTIKESFLLPPEENKEEFQKIEVYSSKS